jgi:nicotinamidase/pyrazinamidase
MWVEPDVAIECVATGEKVERDVFFAELEAGDISEVTVVGVAADYCVRWAIDGLVTRGFAVEVPMALTRRIVRPIEQVIADDFAGAPVRLVAAA